MLAMAMAMGSSRVRTLGLVASVLTMVGACGARSGAGPQGGSTGVAGKGEGGGGGTAPGSAGGIGSGDGGAAGPDAHGGSAGGVAGSLGLGGQGGTAGAGGGGPSAGGNGGKAEAGGGGRGGSPGVGGGGGAAGCPVPLDMPMLLVTGGTFMMGSKIWKDTQPIHAETVATFEIDATEVTTAAYTKCVDAGVCKPDVVGTEAGICNYSVCSRQNHPINCVTWNEATAYCAWAGKRLPTEAEWEYAARSSDNRTYPWGEQAPPVSFVSEAGTGDGWLWSAPVALFPAGRSPFGAFDMAGNVAEWTSSLYCPYDGSACTSTLGVLHGGDFSSSGDSVLNPAGRNPFARGVGAWATTFGFRCAR